MNEFILKANLGFINTIDLIKEKVKADLVYEENIKIDDESFESILIYSKFFLRVPSNETFVLIIKNVEEATNIKIVCPPVSYSKFNKTDFGISNTFCNEMKKILIDFLQ